MDFATAFFGATAIISVVLYFWFDSESGQKWLDK